VSDGFLRHAASLYRGGLLLGLGLNACASRGSAPTPVGEVPFATVGAQTSSPAASDPPAPSASAPSTPAAECSASKVPGTLARAQVVAVVDQGLGRWLGNVDVSPVRREGRFVGWRIEALDNPCYREAGILVGDVITRINGSALETPEQANQVFLGLKTAPRLKVDLLRGGAPHAVSWTIR